MDDYPHNKKKWTTFNDWWNEELVIVNDMKSKFTRKDFILLVTNKDGGAHVDSKLDVAYYDLVKNNTMGWMQINNNIEAPIQDPRLTSIRQIGHEILRTIVNRFPEIGEKLK